MIPKKFILTLAVGITFGFSFAYMVLNASTYPSGSGDYLARTQQIEELTHAHSHEDMEGLAGPEQPVVFHSPEEDAHRGERGNTSLTFSGRKKKYFFGIKSQER